MFGKLRIKHSLQRWFWKKNFTILTIGTGLVLLTSIIFTTVDFVRGARKNENIVQKTVLESELAHFLLALKDDDNFALVDNPSVLSKTKRSLRAITLRKSFFTYFLNQSNAHIFDTKKFSWEPPNSCVVDFTGGAEKFTSAPLQVKGLRACLAVVPKDLTGNYVYFFARFPVSEIKRHMQGHPLTSGSRIVVEFQGNHATRVTKMALVFEPSTLATQRYPSQKARFVGLHEVTAFLGDDPQKLLRTFQGQAYEQTNTDSSGISVRYVTVLGRFDAATVAPSLDAVGQWYSNSPELNAAISVYGESQVNKRPNLQYQTQMHTEGESLSSFEKLYNTHIQSKSLLDISTAQATLGGGFTPIWNSNNFSKKSHGISSSSKTQKVADWWTKKIINVAGYKAQPIEVQQIVKSAPNIELKLSTVPAILPELATRVFLFLSIACLIIVFAAPFYLWVFIQFSRVTRAAYKVTMKPTSEDTLVTYAKKNSEIGMLARTFHILIRRAKSKNLSLVKRTQRETSIRNEQIRRAQEQVTVRQSTLEAIGHEIRSPLQALISKTPETSDLRSYIDRMARAVDALDLATSIEGGLANSRIALKQMNIAGYLGKLAENLSNSSNRIVYVGPRSDITVIADPIALEQVFDHLFENAKTHGTSGTEISIDLIPDGEFVKIVVFNKGSNIKPELIDTVFNYGVTSKPSNKNHGQGLFIAKIYVVGMYGSINVENREGGVALIIALPRKENL